MLPAFLVELKGCSVHGNEEIMMQLRKLSKRKDGIANYAIAVMAAMTPTQLKLYAQSLTNREDLTPPYAELETAGDLLISSHDHFTLLSAVNRLHHIKKTYPSNVEELLLIYCVQRKSQIPYDVRKRALDIICTLTPNRSLITSLLEQIKVEKDDNFKGNLAAALGDIISGQKYYTNNLRLLSQLDVLSEDPNPMVVRRALIASSKLKLNLKPEEKQAIAVKLCLKIESSDDSEEKVVVLDGLKSLQSMNSNVQKLVTELMRDENPFIRLEAARTALTLNIPFNT